MDPDSAPDPAIFVTELQDATKVFLLITYFFEGTFTSFFKDKKLQTVGTKVFLLFMLDDRRIGIRTFD
jgi:hypothetical protein